MPVAPIGVYAADSGMDTTFLRVTPLLLMSMAGIAEKLPDTFRIRLNWLNQNTYYPASMDFITQALGP